MHPASKEGGREALFFHIMGRARCSVEAVLLEFLLGRGFVPSEELAVAYSGGPDSTALLVALRAIGWKRPIAVHVDHGIRPRSELDNELALVRRTCAALGARLIVARLPEGALLAKAKARGEGVEAEARRFRYKALSASLERTAAKAMLLAHNRDDQLETVLMRLFGGSSSGGLKGIPEARGAFLRPFLAIDKADLLSYADASGLGYSTDSTNASDNYLRNRIRQLLVPALDSSFAGWQAGLLLSLDKARVEDVALSEEAASIAFSSTKNPLELSIPADLLLSCPDAVAIRSIIKAAGSLLRVGRFPWKAAAAALAALRRQRSKRYRGAGLELLIRDGEAVLRRSPAISGRSSLDFPRAGGYFVMIDRPRRIRVGSLEVSAAWDLNGSSGIRADAFRFPLVVRTRRPGDSIALKEGTKRLDALFSEWALTQGARRSAAVIEDRDGIVAVLAAGSGGKDRYRSLAEGSSPFGERARRLCIIVKGA